MTAAVSRNPETNVPDVCFCEEKYRLSQDFLDTVRDLLSLQREQTAALIAGDPDFSRFDISIHEASERKDRVKYALLAHMESHGC